MTDRAQTLRAAWIVLKEWEAKYADWSHKPKLEAFFDKHLPPAGHIQVMEDLRGAIEND